MNKDVLPLFNFLSCLVIYPVRFPGHLILVPQTILGGYYIYYSICAASRPKRFSLLVFQLFL